MRRIHLTLGVLASLLGGASVTAAQSTISSEVSDIGSAASISRAGARDAEPVSPALPHPQSAPTSTPFAPPISPSSQRAMPPIRSEPSTTPFGSDMFKGGFGKQSSIGSNPDHEITIGDEIDVQMWGAISRAQLMIVDAQGNIFIPEVGPIHVDGLRARAINQRIASAVKKVYENGVEVYTSLRTAQPLSIFVTGYVGNPGAYNGTSADSVLVFLERAGGVKAGQGSFLNIRVERDRKIVARANLYDFLLRGSSPNVRLRAGDTIIVDAIGPQISVGGRVHNAYLFEFNSPSVPASKALELARPTPDATHMQVERRDGNTRQDFYIPLSQAGTFRLNAGDIVTLVSDQTSKTIMVSVRGEHLGSQVYTLPKGARLIDVLDKVAVSDISEVAGIQLFRKSVARRQREMYLASLDRLEQSVLTARSSSSEEAKLRAGEAQMLTSFIDRARKIEARGQVILAGSQPDDVYLEDGDIITVPTLSSLVMVHGEVLFPTALVYRKGASLQPYIDSAGGLTDNADTSRIIVLKTSGEAVLASSSTTLNPGDEILVLPRVDTKLIQNVKDVFQILYQIAVSAAVVLAL